MIYFNSIYSIELVNVGSMLLYNQLDFDTLSKAKFIKGEGSNFRWWFVLTLDLPGVLREEGRIERRVWIVGPGVPGIDTLLQPLQSSYPVLVWSHGW